MESTELPRTKRGDFFLTETRIKTGVSLYSSSGAAFPLFYRKGKAFKVHALEVDKFHTASRTDRILLGCIGAASAALHFYLSLPPSWAAFLLIFMMPFLLPANKTAPTKTPVFRPASAPPPVTACALRFQCCSSGLLRFRIVPLPPPASSVY